MSGVAARRKADELIAAGLVRVNGEVAPASGRMVAPGLDRVEVEGREVHPAGTRHYYAVHKPVGFLSAVSDRSRRPLVTRLVDRLGLVPAGVAVHPVGRLDLDSSGLMLLTDDGELSYRIQHPRHHVEKEYRVLVAGHPTAAALARLRAGVDLAEGKTGPAKVEILREAGDNTELRVVIRQGWKRQVRRAIGAVGHRVLELRRTRIGPLVLGDLAEGSARELTTDEVAALRAAVGL